MSTLFELSDRAADLRANFEMIAADAGGDMDDPRLVRILDEFLTAEGDVKEKLDAYCALETEDKAVMNALEEEIKRLQARKKARENDVNKRRERLQIFLETNGYESVKTARYTVSLRSGGKARVVIAEGAALPDELCRIERTPDKAAILAALEAGQTIDGVAREEAPKRLVIR